MADPTIICVTPEMLHKLNRQPTPGKPKRRVTMCFFDDIVRQMIEDLERAGCWSDANDKEDDEVKDRIETYIGMFKDYLGED